jgi:hypothetical protein
MSKLNVPHEVEIKAKQYIEISSEIKDMQDQIKEYKKIMKQIKNDMLKSIKERNAGMCFLNDDEIIKTCVNA